MTRKSSTAKHANQLATLRHLKRMLGQFASRICECPVCGHAEIVGQDRLAAHGEPTCRHCECNMHLV
jgi:transcription elongation factor Elf1